MANVTVSIPDAAVPRLLAVVPTVPITPSDPLSGVRRMTAQEFLRFLVRQYLIDQEGKADAATAVSNKTTEVNTLFGL